MIVIEKNEGTKIPYEVDGYVVTFDDDLSLKLNKRQKDDADHIDICFDEKHDLVVGAAAGRAYVAELDIPARKYVEVPDEDGESSHLEPLPLDMDEVTLSLWSID